MAKKEALSATTEVWGARGARPGMSRASRGTTGSVRRPGVIETSRDIFGGAPKTAGEAPALPSDSLISALAWLNLVCLDAPLVAVSWAWVFGRSFSISVTPGAACALFLTAWVIYLADRFGDSLSTDSAAGSSLRQRFCLRHSAAWIGAIASAAAADLFVICTRLDARQLALGAAVGVCALVYLFLNQVLPSVWRVLPAKEIGVGVLFAAGAMVPLADGLTNAACPAWALFAWLCSLNCICIAVWERDLDLAQGRISIATVFPTVRRVLRPALLLLISASLLLAAITSDGRDVYLCVATSALLLTAVQLFRDKIEPDSRTALADLILLTPLAALLIAARSS